MDNTTRELEAKQEEVNYGEWEHLGGLHCKTFFATFPIHTLIYERCSPVGASRIFSHHLILQSWDSNPRHVSCTDQGPLAGCSTA